MLSLLLWTEHIWICHRKEHVVLSIRHATTLPPDNLFKSTAKPGSVNYRRKTFSAWYTWRPPGAPLHLSCGDTCQNVVAPHRRQVKIKARHKRTLMEKGRGIPLRVPCSCSGIFPLGGLPVP